MPLSGRGFDAKSGPVRRFGCLRQHCRKAICRTVVALVGLDSRSTAQLGYFCCRYPAPLGGDMAEIEATMTWKARSRGSLLTARRRDVFVARNADGFEFPRSAPGDYRPALSCWR